LSVDCTAELLESLGGLGGAGGAGAEGGAVAVRRQPDLAAGVGEGVDLDAETDTVVDYSDYDAAEDDYSYDSNIDAEDVALGDDYNETPDYVDEPVVEEAPVEEAPVEEPVVEEPVVEDYNFDEYEEDNIEVEVPLDLPLDEEAIDEDEEEDEEVEVNIDEGFLTDTEGTPVELAPRAATLPTGPQAGNFGAGSRVGGNTFIFFFCALGGSNQNGAVNVVDLINTGLGNAAQSLNIAPMPSQVNFIVIVVSQRSNPGPERRQHELCLHRRSDHHLQSGLHHSLALRLCLQAGQLL
jgi:hypothetical protein